MKKLQLMGSFFSALAATRDLFQWTPGRCGGQLHGGLAQASVSAQVSGPGGPSTASVSGGWHSFRHMRIGCASWSASTGAAPPGTGQGRWQQRRAGHQFELAPAAPAGASGPPLAPPPSSAEPAEPFAWGDFTWVNGTSRQTSHLIDSKYFTPQLDIDLNYTYSFNHPIDNTLVGSSATARHNEAADRLHRPGRRCSPGQRPRPPLLQYGTRSTVVPRNDLTANRGQFDLLTIYRYIGGPTSATTSTSCTG